MKIWPTLAIWRCANPVAHRKGCEQGGLGRAMIGPDIDYSHPDIPICKGRVAEARVRRVIDFE